jgi:7-cyano-7-deazaguanine synthase
MDKISEIRGEKPMKAVVLFSGGLDSTTCLALAVNDYGADNVLALSLYYGQKHKKEIECARQIARHYNVKHIEYNVQDIFAETDCTLIGGNADIPETSYVEQLTETGGKPVSTYVPFRNGLFLSIAASLAISNGCNVIYYGAHQDDAAGNAYPDCSTQFNNAISEAVYCGSGNAVKVIAPFIQKNKADIVREGTKLRVPYEMTWSCYKGGDRPCGKCGTCIDRIKAFELNGIKDPLKYN